MCMLVCLEPDIILYNQQLFYLSHLPMETTLLRSFYPACYIQEPVLEFRVLVQVSLESVVPLKSVQME